MIKEYWALRAQQVQVVATPEIFAAAPSGQTWTLPMLITSVALKDSSKHAAMRANADVKAALQTNHTKFLEEERRLKTSIRGSVDFKEPAVASIALEGMLEAFPWKTLQPAPSPSGLEGSTGGLHEALMPQIFGMSINEVWCQAARRWDSRVGQLGASV